MAESYLKQYRLLEKIGEGGMGAVFKADDTRLHRLVALKILGESGDIARRPADLLREARSASALNHPNICVVYECGEDGGQGFIAMEWIDGPPLGAAIPPGGLPVETVLRYGVQIAGALAHAHDGGVIHRDLKASNVVLTRDGRPKIVDFGLARRTAVEVDALTRSQGSFGDSRLVGTLAYLAPELLAGAPAGVTSDIWALGVLLYEMTAGARPFRGETGAALAGAVMAGASRALGAKVPRPLQSVIHRCLAREPSDRYQHAHEVRAVLEAAQASLASAEPAVPRPMRPARRPRGSRIASLAVLPLDNLSKDPDQEYFADGMTEALTTALARLGSIKIISRTSAMRFKGTTTPLPEIARELNVDGIIEGSVLRAGDRVRVTAQLIHAATDTHVWANSYDGELSDVLALHSDIARAVAAEIQGKVARRESRGARRRVDPRAQDAYLKGRYHWSRRSPQDLTLAFNYFSEAVALDPGYALAHVGLADYYDRLGRFHLVAPGDAFPKAKAAVLRALELDPELGEAHATLGILLYAWDWQWAGAEQALTRALALSPSYAEAEAQRALFCAFMGRFDDARAAARRARELDPLSPVTLGNVGLVDYFGRHFDRAIEPLTQAWEGLSHAVFLPLNLLALCHVQRGALDEALRVLQQGRAALPDNADVLAVFGYACGIAGRRREAEDACEELRRIEWERYVSPFVMALPFVGLGDHDQAMACLERAYATRAWQLVTVKVEPSFEPLRSDARFQDLVRRMHFSP